jgi:hypothetical protein
MKYALAILREARQYGKPVYAFLWPRYHDSNRFIGGQPISRKFWRKQLETVYRHADGVVIWDYDRSLWREYMPWWLETKAFLLSHRLYKNRN